MQIHGGSWQNGALTSQEWFSRYFAERGYVCGYRLSSRAGMEVAGADCRCAHSAYWILNDSPSSTVIRAASSLWALAGAQLAMRLAYQEDRRPLRRRELLRAVDLTEGGASLRNPIPPASAAFSRCSSAARRNRSPSTIAMPRP
jgi:acetyl esterase/lipase